MTTLEIILILILWISYGAFNAYQHDWHREDVNPEVCTIFNIVGAPIALIIRIMKGILSDKLN